MNTFSALSFLCIVLAAIAGTLGAGGYLLFRMLDQRFRQLEGTAAAAGAAGIGVVAKIVGALEAIAKRPHAAAIAVQREGLVAVHDMACIVGWGVVPPGQTIAITVAPVRADLFQVKAMRMHAHVVDLPSVEQRVVIVSGEVNQCPQFHWSGSTWSYGLRGSPPANSNACLPSDVFAAPPGFAIGVSMAPCTNAQLIQTLVIQVRNDNPHPVRVAIEGYGEPLDPMTRKPWVPPPSEDMDTSSEECR